MSAALATTTALPAQPATVTGPTREAANAAAAAPSAQGSGETSTQSAAAPANAPGIGFTLTFDTDTQRLILEARDPVTGFVIYQMPPKYVLKQLAAAASAASTRGAKVDSAI